jgi:hypothetical protein
MDFNPLDHVGWALLGDMYSQLGLDQRAVRAIQRAVEVVESGHPFDWLPLAFRLAHAIRTDDMTAATSVADSLRQRSRRAAADFDVFLAIRYGDFERALGLLGASDANEPRHLAYLAWVQRQLGDTVQAKETLTEARARTSISAWVDMGYPRLLTAAVADDPASVAQALAEYTDAGGRDARRIRRDPLFDRVREHPSFEAAFARLEEILARQRRQVERDLAGEE